MDKNLQKDFIVHKGLALSCSVDVNNCNLDKVSRLSLLQDFVIQLGKLLHVERINDCIMTTLGKGVETFISFVQIISGGVISGHVCPTQGVVFVDVFLKEVFDPSIVESFTQEFFNGGLKSMSRKIRN